MTSSIAFSPANLFALGLFNVRICLAYKLTPILPTAGFRRVKIHILENSRRANWSRGTVVNPRDIRSIPIVGRIY